MNIHSLFPKLRNRKKVTKQINSINQSQDIRNVKKSQVFPLTVILLVYLNFIKLDLLVFFIINWSRENAMFDKDFEGFINRGCCWYFDYFTFKRKVRCGRYGAHGKLKQRKKKKLMILFLFVLPH